MIANFLLALGLIAAATLSLGALGRSPLLIEGVARRLLRLSRRSKLLTASLLRAYLHYRRMVKLSA